MRMAHRMMLVELMDEVNKDDGISDDSDKEL